MTHRKGYRLNNKNKPWTKVEIQKIKKLTKENTPTPLIADTIGRTLAAIYSKASQEGISLGPTNKPPYNRRKKGSKSEKVKLLKMF